MTTKSRRYPTRTEVKHDTKIGRVVIDQIRTIDKRRIIKIMERLSGNKRDQICHPGDLR